MCLFVTSLAMQQNKYLFVESNLLIFFTSVDSIFRYTKHPITEHYSGYTYSVNIVKINAASENAKDVK